MPVWKKTYPVIDTTDAWQDMKRAIEVHQHSDDIHLCNFDVDFTADGDAHVTVITWTRSDDDPGVFPLEIGQQGAEDIPWEAVPQACGGGDPT